MDGHTLTTLLIVAATIVGVATGRWPLLRANRATIALIGAALLLATGALRLDQAYAALDLDTLLLLFSLMVLNGNLYLAGFFGVVTRFLPLMLGRTLTSHPASFPLTGIANLVQY